MDDGSLEKGESMAQGKTYPPEFRAEAVRLYRMGGRTLAGTARKIGVS
jgi:transposase-like protein